MSKNKELKIQRAQTPAEELLNALTHGAGALLSVIGTVILLFINGKGTAGALSALLYGISLAVLYLSSTLYHSIRAPRAKRVLQVLDHCTIFLLISGTYAPISLLLIGGTTGLVLISANFAAAVFGIVLNAVNMARFKRVSMILYVVMGWMCLFTLKPLIEKAPSGTLWLLVAGGVAYTVGIVFYKMKQVKFMHFVWHLFVLAGSLLQYLFIIESCYK